MEKCKHCVMEIPEEAKICPYCRKKQGIVKIRTWALLCVGGFLSLVWLGCGFSGSPSSDGSQTQKPDFTINTSPEEQTRRKKQIENLIVSGIFTKTEGPGDFSTAKAWVGPRFYELPSEGQRRFVKDIYENYFDGSNKTDSVLLFDGNTNQEIGEFYPDIPYLEIY